MTHAPAAGPPCGPLWETGRNSYGFEIDRNFYKQAKERMIGGYFEELEKSSQQLYIFG